MQDSNLADEIAGPENAGHENAGMENGKCTKLNISQALRYSFMWI